MIVFFLIALGILGVFLYLLSAAPSKGLALLSGVATILSSAIATYFWIENAKLDDLAAVRFYSLDTNTPGTKTIRLHAVPGVPGLNARPVPKGTRREFQTFQDESLPVSHADVMSCGWKFKTEGIDLHLHDGGCGCLPGDDLFDTSIDDRFREGGLEYLELTYIVDDRTKPILDAIDLQVGFPMTFGNDLAFGKAFTGFPGAFFTFSTFLGILAFLGHVIRLRTRTPARREES